VTLHVYRLDITDMTLYMSDGTLVTFKMLFASIRSHKIHYCAFIINLHSLFCMFKGWYFISMYIPKIVLYGILCSDSHWNYPRLYVLSKSVNNLTVLII